MKKKKLKNQDNFLERRMIFFFGVCKSTVPISLKRAVVVVVVSVVEVVVVSVVEVVVVSVVVE